MKRWTLEPAWPRTARTFALSLCSLALAAPFSAQDEGRTPPARPNVLILLADDLGYGDIGVHGCADIPTPNIDAIAREGVRCTSGYVSGPRCTPSRCGLLTGRYQQRFGCELDAPEGLPRDELTLAERLKPAGYATGLIGKWHLGKADEDHPNARGFDEFFGFLGGVNAYLPGEEAFPRILRGRGPAQEKGHLTEAFAREARSFLERHAREPFCLLVAFNAPHGPLAAPAERLAGFAAIAEPKRRAYAAVVAGMDDAIGSILAKLRELGLDEKTLVLFLSDNGGPAKRTWNGSSNAPLRGQKGSLWEGGIRVPFLARWQGVLPAGRVYEEAVSALDVAPTVLALAGVAPAGEHALDGVDILPHLAGRTLEPPHAALFWRFSFPQNEPDEHKWAIRAGDAKLVCSPERDEKTGEARGIGVTGLYDLARDPGEAHDVAGERPELARELEARWRAWNASLPPPPKGGRGSAGAADEHDEPDDD
jgi:arylsulfatase A-like enzyme